MLDGTLANEPSKMAKIWDLRERIAEALLHEGYVYKLVVLVLVLFVVFGGVGGNVIVWQSEPVPTSRQRCGIDIWRTSLCICSCSLSLSSWKYTFRGHKLGCRLGELICLIYGRGVRFLRELCS